MRLKIYKLFLILLMLPISFTEALAPRSQGGVGASIWEETTPFTREEINPENIRSLFERFAPIYGGKGFWMKVLELLSKDKDSKFSVPQTRYITTDMWRHFFQSQKDRIDQINHLLEESRDDENKLTELEKAIYTLEMPWKELPNELGKIIRSAGVQEDSFEHNLAGVLISLCPDEDSDLEETLRKILLQYIKTVLIDQYVKTQNKEGIAGLPPEITLDGGMAFLVQNFLSFSASGTAMSDLLGYTTIEAVFGDAVTSVKGSGDNSLVCTIEKRTRDLKQIPAYEFLPSECVFKGKPYRRGEDPEAMLQKIQAADYPRISGKYHPITYAQTMDIFDEVQKLEKKLGFKLDLEWGFVNGRLNFTQVRPITKDFPGPLVKKSDKLAKAIPIAESPVALGKTLPLKESEKSEGFTGKMVLIAARSTDQETLTTLEAIDKDPSIGKYIRVQIDAASYAGYMKKTNAQVLVCPLSSTRQAHNINLIYDRIAEGEFIYVNGKVLRKGLLENVEFEPHPTLEGVWVSKGEVTYWSNGLEGAFYQLKKRTGKRKPEGINDDKTSRRIQFHKKAMDFWEKAPRDFKKYTEDEIIMEMLNLLDPDFEKHSQILEQILKTPEEKLDELYGKFSEQSEALLALIPNLRQTLSNPLYPSYIDNRWMKLFRKILIFEQMKPLPHLKTRRNISYSKGDKIRILVLDDDKNFLSTLRVNLRELDPKQYELQYANSYQEANQLFGQNPFDVVVMDLQLFPETGKKEFDTFASRAPLLITSSGMEKDAQQKVMNARFPGFSTNDMLPLLKHECSDLIETIKNSAPRISQFKTPAASAPKMRMLILEDDDSIRNFLKAAFKHYLDADHFSSFEYCKDYDEANLLLSQHQFDIVMMDITVGKGNEMEFYEKLASIPYILGNSGFGEENVLAKFHQHFGVQKTQRMNSVKNLFVTGKPFDLSEIIEILKRFYADFSKGEEEPASSHQNAILILRDRFQELFFLEEAVKNQVRPECPVISLSSNDELKIKLKQASPFLVVIEDSEHLDRDMMEILNKNTQVKFIVVSGNPEKTRKSIKVPHSILSIERRTFGIPGIIKAMNEFLSQHKPLTPKREEMVRKAA